MNTMKSSNSLHQGPLQLQDMVAFLGQFLGLTEHLQWHLNETIVGAGSSKEQIGCAIICSTQHLLILLSLVTLKPTAKSFFLSHSKRRLRVGPFLQCHPRRLLAPCRTLMILMA